MEHPFTQNMELTDQAIQNISAGTAVDIVLVECNEDGNSATKRPCLGTTLAIGEEGGGFFY